MEREMTVPLPIKEIEKFEITKYSKTQDIKHLKQAHVAFAGSPRKHPYDPGRIILVNDPLGSGMFYFEFDKRDISYVEDLPNMVDADQEVVTMVRIWVRKGSVGLRCTPFWVEKPIIA